MKQKTRQVITLLKSRVQSFQENFIWAGFFFLMLGVFEIYNHGEYMLCITSTFAFLLGILFSHLLCLRHNHLNLARISLLLFVLFSHVIHSGVDGFVFHTSLVLGQKGDTIMYTTPLLIFLHEIFRQAVLFSVVKKITKNTLLSVILIPGIFMAIIIYFSYSVTEILPGWSHDIAILSYFFLAGEIIWHERKNVNKLFV